MLSLLPSTVKNYGLGLKPKDHRSSRKVCYYRLFLYETSPKGTNHVQKTVSNQTSEATTGRNLKEQMVGNILL